MCSDDKDARQRFDALPNIAIFCKRADGKKLVEEGGWNSVTSDRSGRAYACNIIRSTISVIDAAVDMRILSRSEGVKTSSSTSLQTALLIRVTREP